MIRNKEYRRMLTLFIRLVSKKTLQLHYGIDIIVSLLRVIDGLALFSQTSTSRRLATIYEHTRTMTA